MLEKKDAFFLKKHEQLLGQTENLRLPLRPIFEGT